MLMCVAFDEKILSFQLALTSNNVTRNYEINAVVIVTLTIGAGATLTYEGAGHTGAAAGQAAGAGHGCDT